MTNSRARGGALEKLFDYTAASAEASVTYTPSAPLTHAKYSRIIIDIDGKATAALALELVVNSVEGTANHNHGIRCTGAALAAVQNNSTAQIDLLSATVLAAAYPFAGTVNIQLSDIDDDFEITSKFNSGIAGAYEDMGGFISTTATTYITIKIQTSTSTWVIGTRITMYGVLR